MNDEVYTMNDELYEDLFGPDPPPTAPSSVAAAPGHGEFERDETPEATDADGVDNSQVPVEDTANVVDRSVTRCPSALATPPRRALGGAAELAGSPSSTATPPVALGAAGQAFEPVLPPLPPYPCVNGAQRGASLPRQPNASLPVVPPPQHAYRQAAAPFFQGHGGYGGMPPPTAPQTFATGYASAPHIPQSNGLPHNGPAAHYPFNPAAYAYALRTGYLAPASGSRAFPGAAQLNYSQPNSYSQYSGQFYGAYPMQVTGPRPNSPLYPDQQGGRGGATTARPTAARQPVTVDSRSYASQIQNFPPAATGNYSNGGTAYAYYRNNVASHGAQQAPAQGVFQPNYASTSTARAPQARNVGMPQPCPPALHMYAQPHAQDRPTAARQPVTADSRSYASQNQNFPPAATGNYSNGGTAYAYYRNNVASLGAQQAPAQGVFQLNFASSTSTARAPQARNVGVPQPCPPAMHMYAQPHAQDHSASGKKRLRPDSDPDFGVPPDVQPDAGLATHYGSVVAPQPPASTRREPGEKKQTAKDKKYYLDPKFLESLPKKTVDHLEASRPDGEENLYECKLPLRPDKDGGPHPLLDVGTLRLHLSDFHDYQSPSRKSGSAKGEPAVKVRCQWSSEPDGARCGKELNKTNMAQHVISCHILSDWFRCPACKLPFKARMPLARHMKVCEYWTNGLIKGLQPFMRPAKIARRDGEEDVSGAGANVQTA